MLVNQSCPGCFIVILSVYNFIKGFPIDHTNEIKIPLIVTVIVWYFNGVMSSNLIRDALCLRQYYVYCNYEANVTNLKYSSWLKLDEVTTIIRNY